MNILITYATNSGSTFAAVGVAGDTLKGLNHAVTIKEAMSTTPEDVAANDVIILATPSWDYQDKEGQPHEDITNFIAKLAGKTYENKSFAVLGLGDTSYSHFNGAVDILEAKIAEFKGKKIIDSLRIDRYYTQPGNPEKVTEWAKKLAEMLPH